MPTNETRRELLNRAKASGFPGSITDVFQAADQGIDLIEQHQMQQQQEQEMQVANTPEEQETGLREQHAAGNTQASMAFPDVQPNQSFNTVGMAAPIDIQKIDDQGHLVESYENVPPGIQDLPTGPSEGTIIESPAAYQKGGFDYSKKFDYSPEAIKERQSKGVDYENVELGASFAPYLGEVIDAKNTIKSLKERKYGDAALHAAGFALPFVPGKALVKGYNKLFKTQDPNALYRVVDASGNVEAAKFGSTIPDVKTTGRRTGYKDIQKNTDFDVLNTTSDQKWIAGSGTNDKTSLFNTYGGKNPYVVKIARGSGDETIDVINARTNILNDFQFPYTQNVGKWNPVTGQFDLPLELGAGVYTTVGKSADDLAKIPPGSIVNPNYLSRGNQNITTIFGPKGTKVRNVEGVMSKAEYLEALKKDPNFKFNKGGFKSKYQVGGYKSYDLLNMNKEKSEKDARNIFLQRQRYAESSFNPNAVSGAGAMGIAQFMPITITDMKQRGIVKDNFNPFDYRQATRAQEKYMNYLSERPYINKGTDQVKLAKQLAGYNMGGPRLFGVLKAMKKDGINIYDDLNWVDKLPKYYTDRKTGEPITETTGYIHKILSKTNPRFERDYKKASTTEFFKPKRKGGYRSKYF